MNDNDSEIHRGLQIVDEALDSASHEILDEGISPTSLGKIFGVLCAVLAEFPPYKLETAVDPTTRIPTQKSLVDDLSKRRGQAANILLNLFRHSKLSFLKDDLRGFDALIESTLESRRFMPFRVIQVGKLADRLFNYSLYFDAQENELLRCLHSFKYVRFGTSGWRGRWNIDFEERTAKCVAQAICDFVTGRSVPGFVANAVPRGSDRLGKILLIGYDSRAHARRVAEWVAHVAVKNGLEIRFTKRDTPTPALIYWATEVVGEKNMAGIVNCTASHNPPEWQGIKFSPYNGVPAPTAITDFLAARANRLKLQDVKFSRTPRGYASRLPEEQIFDPKESYLTWLLSPQRKGLPINPAAIRRHFSERMVVIDEMHGTSRGYFRKLMRWIGVRYSVIHGHRSQKALAELGYASPEWPYIAPLAEEVKKRDATLGLGFDTDSDRFGIIDENGRYITPNQILPLLTEHLIRRGFKGKLVRTVPDSRLIDLIAEDAVIPKQYRPSPSVIPSYMRHAFYTTTKGKEDLFCGLSIFLVPVGIKYVIEGMLVDPEYKASYSPGFRNTMLLGGEESSGLTSKGHIPDKDGIWGNLLVMDMIATEGASLETLWKNLCSKYGVAYFERLDVDAPDVAKERLVNYFLRKDVPDIFAGLDIKFIGGIAYDMVEIQLHSKDPDAEVYLEVRASGTEPLNRIYVEAIAPPTGTENEVKSLVKKAQLEVLNLLEHFSIDETKLSHTPRELACILAVTSPDGAAIRGAVADKLSSGSSRRDTLACLEQMLDYLELRNRDTARSWLNLMSNEGLSPQNETGTDESSIQK